MLCIPCPLQVPQVDTSRVFGGQVTNLRWLRGLEKNDDLDSAFLLLVEMLLALGKAKSRKDHWVSITSTCFKRGPSGFKNVFLVCDTVSEFLADKEPQCGRRPDSPWVASAGQVTSRSPSSPGIFQFVLHDLLSLLNH